MSTQSYYKDRLGFDPREALYESSGGSTQSTTIKTASRRFIQQQQHYSSSTTAHHSSSNGSGGSPVGGGNGGGGGGGAGSPNAGYYSASPTKKLKHTVYSSSNTTNTAISSSGQYVSGSPAAQIGANIAAINSNNQGDGYEDALTQFKGTMSIWDYFVENRDATGTTYVHIECTHTHLWRGVMWFGVVWCGLAPFGFLQCDATGRRRQMCVLCVVSA